MEILKSLQVIFTLVILISIGIIARKRNWVDEHSSKAISKIAMTIAIPSNIFYTLISNYDKKSLLQIIASIEIPIIAILVVVIISFFLALIIKIPKHRTGIFIVMSSFSNCIFIGIPVVSSILGNEATAYLSIYYIVNTLLFWTIGLFFIKKDARIISNTKREKSKNILHFILSVLKYFINPVIILFLLATMVIMFSIKLPLFIIDSFKYLSNAATPLSMIYVGSSLYLVFKENLLKNIPVKDITFVVIMKFFILPIIVYSLLKHVDMPLLLERTFILASLMPSMNQSVIVGSNYKADAKYAVIGTTSTLLFTPIGITIYMVFMYLGYI